MASQVEFAKRVPGTSFLVDGFRFQRPGCSSYFLTHFHSDHTTGLARGFNAGLIYCSEVTAALVVGELGVRRQYVHPVPLGVPFMVEGVEVTALDANHCPGSAMFLFRVPGGGTGDGGASGGGGSGGQVVLHTGDMRWHDAMAAHPALSGARIDVLMLDTTYCAPKWVFPPQEDAVTALAGLLAAEARAEPATLFLVGSYHIGKERAYLGAAHRLGWRVYCPPAKHRVLQLLRLPPEWMALLVASEADADLHVQPMGGEAMHEDALAQRVAGSRWRRVVAIRPTGWSYRKSGLDVRRISDAVTVVGLPYSEHSSFPELRRCVAALRPRRLVPTVGATDAAKARAIVDLFADCMDLSGDRSRLDCYFQKPGPITAHAAGAAGKGTAGAAAAEAASCEQAASSAAAQPAAAAPPPPSPPGGSEPTPATPAPGALAACGCVEGACACVDLTQVDAAEQQRILDAITAGSRKRPASEGSGTPGLKQGSLRGFLRPRSD